MESPITIVKSSLNLSKITGFLAVGIFAFALLDLLGVTNWILFPVTTARSKFGRGPAA